MVDPEPPIDAKQERIVFLLLAPVCGLTILVMLYRLCFPDRTQGAEARCRGMKRLIAFVKLGCKSQKPKDELGLRVYEQIRDQKIRAYRLFCQLSCILLVWLSLYILLGIYRKRKRDQTFGQDLATLGTMILCSMGYVKPLWINDKSMDFHYFALIICACGYLSPFTCTPSYIVPPILYVNVLVTLLNLIRRTNAENRIPVFLWANLIFLVSSFSAVVVHGPEAFSHAITAAFFQGAVVTVGMWAASVLEARIALTSRQRLELHQTQELHESACALLRSMCQCTVELDSEGLIICKEDGIFPYCDKDLGNLLFKGKGPVLKGLHLSDLMVDVEDKAVFRARLKEPQMRKQGRAEQMSCCLQGDGGEQHRLDLLWYEFKRNNGKRYFMTGIRDFSEQSGLRAAGDGAALPDEPFSEPSPLGECLETTSVTSQESGAAMIMVDCLTDGMPIKAVTPAFEAQLGPLTLQEPLVNYLVYPQLISRWLVKAAASQQPHVRRVDLRLPGGRVRAACKVLGRGIDAPSSKEEHMSEVPLLFFSISRAGQTRRDSVRL